MQFHPLKAMSSVRENTPLFDSYMHAVLYTDCQCQVFTKTTNITDSQMKDNPLTKNQYICSPSGHTLESSRSSGGKKLSSRRKLVLLKGRKTSQPSGPP